MKVNENVCVDCGDEHTCNALEKHRTDGLQVYLGVVLVTVVEGELKVVDTYFAAGRKERRCILLTVHKIFTMLHQSHGCVLTTKKNSTEEKLGAYNQISNHQFSLSMKLKTKIFITKRSRKMYLSQPPVRVHRATSESYLWAIDVNDQESTSPPPLRLLIFPASLYLFFHALVNSPFSFSHFFLISSSDSVR